MKRSALMLCVVAAFGLPGVAWCDSSGPANGAVHTYPPSCLSYPLPEPSGPTWTARAPLELDGPSDHHEQVNFVFWRSPCKGEKSALLGRMFRDPANAGKQPAPVFSGFGINQGSAATTPRVALEPNTVASYVPFGVSVSDAMTFVLEGSGAAAFDPSQALTLSIAAAESTATVAIPAYDEKQYPIADLPLQISGYATGNWYDAAHAGEGAQVEVGELSAVDRYLTFAWYTFDAAGRPFWLFGQGSFATGDRSVTLTMAYAGGGAFAGGGRNATLSAWGTLTLSFPDCNAMHFSFQSNAGVPDTVPQGSGSRDWTRVTSINGLACE